MPWPPSADFPVSDNVRRPSCLEGFLECLLPVKSDSSENRQRLVTSFAQDICKAVTNGKWTLPKHLLLGMTLRHLTGSAEVITLVNRFGHCASYSRVIELETAMCKAIASTASDMTCKLGITFANESKDFYMEKSSQISCRRAKRSWLVEDRWRKRFRLNGNC